MRRERTSPSRWPGGDNDKTEADSIQQWKANLVLLQIVYDTMASKFMDPLLEVEKRQLREVSWANKHKTHELVNDDDARGPHQVHAKWLPTSRGNKVRNGLGKTQFAVSVEPSAVQSVSLRDSPQHCRWRLLRSTLTYTRCEVRASPTVL